MNGHKTPNMEQWRAYNAVLDWFFMQPDKAVSLRQLSELLGIHARAVGAAVRQLSKEGFIQKTVVGRAWQLVARQDHKYFTTRKIGHNLIKVYDSGIVEDILKRWKNPVAIILFGSYRYGKDIETSDIDIAVELSGDEPHRIQELCTVSFPFRKPVKVQLHTYGRKSIDPNLFVNIANGIVLYGLLEVRP